MKILMIAPTPFFSDRGCHVRIYEEAKNLVALGNIVTICTYHLGNDIPGLDVRRIINIPWYKKISAGPSLHKMYLDLLLLIKSIVVAYQIKPNIIHAHLHEGAFIGKICSMLFRVPLVFDVQGEFVKEIEAHEFMKSLVRNRIASTVLSTLEKLSYKSATTFLVNSELMRDRISKNFSISKESIFIVPDAAGSPFHSNSSNKSELLRRKLNIPANKKVVVYLGLLTEYQGVGLLLRVIKSITGKRDDVHFLIMGYPDVEKYKRISEELNISDHVTFTGRISYTDIYDYLALGTIAVSPKLLESGEGNIKVFNYIAAGLPTVVFDYPLNREILGNLGIYAEPKDPLSLENCMTQLLDDDAIRLRMVEKLKRIDKKNYYWNNSIKEVLQAYHSSKGKQILSDNIPKSKSRKP